MEKRGGIGEEWGGREKASPQEWTQIERKGELKEYNEKRKKELRKSTQREGGLSRKQNKLYI